MKIKTNDLARLVNIAYKAVGNNKIIPFTQMIGIRLEGDRLTLAGSDSFNFLYINEKVENPSNESFDLCINADTLSKLVSKFTTEFTELKMTNNYLEVNGNGKYQLNVLLDDTGEVYTYIKKTIPEDATAQELDLSKFTNLKFYGEKSLAQTMEEPSLIAYYVDDKEAVATDRNIMTIIDEGITNTPLTLRSKFVELVTLMKEKVKLSTWSNSTTGETLISMTDGSIFVFSKVNTQVEDYPVEPINNLIQTAEFDIKGKINTKELLNILDRISLMVTDYDSNLIDMKLSVGKLYISSLKSTGIEVVNLKDIDNNATWQGAIDIEMLKGQLTSFVKEDIDIYLGNDSCIKLVEGNVTKLICLAEIN